jgi:hypothetical protein
VPRPPEHGRGGRAGETAPHDGNIGVPHGRISGSKAAWARSAISP